VRWGGQEELGKGGTQMECKDKKNYLRFDFGGNWTGLWHFVTELILKISPVQVYRMCCTVCAATAIYRMCCTVCAVPYVLYRMCCTVCAVPYVQLLRYTVCAVPYVQLLRYTVCAVPYVLYRM
jgi:hypothetical protein